SVLLAEHQVNFNALIHHSPGTIGIVAHQFRASRAHAFPFLEPFGPTHLNAPSWQKNVITKMEEDHFSIFRGASLHKIVASMFQHKTKMNTGFHKHRTLEQSACHASEN